MNAIQLLLGRLNILPAKNSLTVEKVIVTLPRPQAYVGAYVPITTSIMVKARRGNQALVTIEDLDDYEDEFEEYLCAVLTFDQHDQVTEFVKATEEDWNRFRLPLWLQDDETPTCCGRLMFFVGQINDDQLYEQPPPDAKMWWHDQASFYVFTCPKCLLVKAIGQQL